MSDRNNSDEINLKDLARKVVKTYKRKKKPFAWLLLIIMLLSSVYFVKVLMKPSYKSEVILKSRFVRKDQLLTILDRYNSAIADEEQTVPANLTNCLIDYGVVKFDMNQIIPDIASPERNDITKYYKLTAYYQAKPKNINSKMIDTIINDIKLQAAKDNDVKIGIINTTGAIRDLDSLLETALPVGEVFKNKINTSSGMLVINDLYTSLNGLLARKNQLETELMYYQTENIIFKASPILISKKIAIPLIIPVIGFLVWLFITILWTFSIIIFGEDDSLTKENN